MVHGGFFLYFAVSVNWIGPEFQRKVRGAPFHPSFSWATTLPTATVATAAMPIAAVLIASFPPDAVSRA
jgi:hypothetical protein